MAAARSRDARVPVWPKHAAPLEETLSSRIRSSGGGQAIALGSWMSRKKDSEARLLDAAAEAELGTPWAVFANAGRGLSRTSDTKRSPDAEMVAIFEVNFFATHRLSCGSGTRRMISAWPGWTPAGMRILSFHDSPYPDHWPPMPPPRRRRTCSARRCDSN